MIDVELNDLLIKMYRAGKEFGLIEGRKQGALEEFQLIKGMYYRFDVNRFMEFLNQEKLKFEKEGVEK